MPPVKKLLVVDADPETVRLLIELEADVNARTPSGDTPLKVARNGDQEDVAEMLLAAGAREE